MSEENLDIQKLVIHLVDRVKNLEEIQLQIVDALKEHAIPLKVARQIRPRPVPTPVDNTVPIKPSISRVSWFETAGEAREGETDYDKTKAIKKSRAGYKRTVKENDSRS